MVPTSALLGLLLISMTILAGCAGGTASRAPAHPASPAEPAPDGGFARNAQAAPLCGLLDASGRPLTASALATAAAAADYILVGESHAAPCDHEAQAAILEALVASGLRPAIGLEMVDVTRQAILSAFGRGKLAVADLPRALEWEKNWGFDFSMYAPVFELAAHSHLPVFALNLPSPLARTIGAKGTAALTPAESALAPGEIIPPGEKAGKRLSAFFQDHQAMVSPGRRPVHTTPPPPPGTDSPRLAAFLTVQSLWDTQMGFAAVAARAASSRPIFILAGSWHVEYGDGIAARIRRLDPEARVLTVMPWRGGKAPESGQADLYFFCPQTLRSRLGFSLESDDPEAGKPLSVLISAVEPGSRAERAGLLAGDAIVAVAGTPLSSLFDLHTAAMEAGKAKKPLALTVRRGGETLDIAVDLPGRAK
ncbi:ChaN family lipoprotein [Desulfolutivibrio sulfoxidireducens]|uniref:ChaN family lipoprotein n=1 Tax=Desulfolutivibrio sulfoxidireducens TaxID=2773299 RepID=UPI00159E0E50|nr:ChaN family lipoprotein [Desulfolutivibrio sulfoxidireducens]QLA16052.1 PDZ domain-containing protein [Desulfolutivibrio sulfoxidireducens]QLA20038.1 PDZ domain-containing protein [Desulfolutivibrio sulfoxidireducens]